MADYLIGVSNSSQATCGDRFSSEVKFRTEFLEFFKQFTADMIIQRWYSLTSILIGSRIISTLFTNITDQKPKVTFSIIN